MGFKIELEKKQIYFILTCVPFSMWARAQKHVPKNHEEIFIVGNTYATLYYRSIRNMNTIKIKRVPVSVITKFKL